MSNKDAFTFLIAPNGSGLNEEDTIHQMSPAWVLTFLRWKVRDTLRTDPETDLNFSTVSPPLVVESDCIGVSISDSKSVLTPSLNASLLVTDVNYETALAPGDFVFANMLNWEKDARRVANNARFLRPINGQDDGFKGIFKIQSVRKALVTDPESGTKMYAVKITAFAFTEFNNTIYFNPYLIDKSENNSILFQSLIGDNWNLIASNKGLTKVQDLVRALILSFIGSGVTDTGHKDVIEDVKSLNPHFYMPKTVGNLLGITGLQSAKDSYNYLFGIQQYSSGTNQTLAQGMNPTGVPQDSTNSSRFIITNQALDGRAISKPDYWNQVKVWSILNQFTNSPLNEMYTCFRISPNGRVMPTLVFRQIPFTTSSFDSGSYNVTRFMNIPRWNISPFLALGFDLGRDEAARINFVQYFGRSTIGPEGYSISEEIAKQNYLYDSDDVLRNGLRPYVVSTQFDEPPDSGSKADFRAPGWAHIVGDALIGGHLKLSGTINFVGIVEPISVGDNLQFDGVVYHIEQITHTCIFQPQNGKKTFRTTIAVSNGVSIDSDSSGVVYPEMTFGGAYAARREDYDKEQLLPGISESQNIVYRPGSPDVPHSQDAPNSGLGSFTEPNTGTSINKSRRDGS